MMDQNANVNLQVVQGDFSLKYGPKTLKHTWSISLNPLRPFQNYILNIQWETHFLLFQIMTKTLQKKLE